jgi:hypothetical protein
LAISSPFPDLLKAMAVRGLLLVGMFVDVALSVRADG